MTMSWMSSPLKSANKDQQEIIVQDYARDMFEKILTSTPAAKEW